MHNSEIADKADFDQIRYAQLWEDADVLNGALGTRPGAKLVSICSAGDNALGLLLLDPERVTAIDLSAAQIACLRLRIAMLQTLDHGEFLELMGSRPSDRRPLLLNRALAALTPEDRAFWQAQQANIAQHGLGGIGKFERYFRLFRQIFLPLVHGPRTIADVFQSRPHAEREIFMRERWNSWRWRLLLKLFFSNFVMGRLGRDPAFFEHVQDSAAEHVALRIEHAAVDLDPADNPYLHWILTGTHGKALPLAWRPENYEIIRSRLDRLDVKHAPIEELIAGGERFDGFNLSDIFEYMSAPVFESVYGSVLSAASPEARLVYWNMMVPRRVPQAHRARVKTLVDEEKAGKAQDKAFFYSDFVVEEVVP
jgi:S-adenosylmethionine-diacylglycerol 3-amino-3-carboxypropyl transferase